MPVVPCCGYHFPNFYFVPVPLYSLFLFSSFTLFLSILNHVRRSTRPGPAEARPDCAWPGRTVWRFPALCDSGAIWRKGCPREDMRWGPFLPGSLDAAPESRHLEQTPEDLLGVGTCCVKCLRSLWAQVGLPLGLLDSPVIIIAAESS